MEVRDQLVMQRMQAVKMEPIVVWKGHTLLASKEFASTGKCKKLLLANSLPDYFMGVNFRWSWSITSICLACNLHGCQFPLALFKSVIFFACNFHACNFHGCQFPFQHLLSLQLFGCQYFGCQILIPAFAWAAICMGSIFLGRFFFS